MSTLDIKVGHARTRLTLNLFLRWLSQGVLVGALLWILAVLVLRLLAGLGVAGIHPEYGALLVAVIAALPGRVGPGFWRAVWRRVPRALIIGAVYLVEAVVLRFLPDISVWHGAWVLAAVAALVGVLGTMLTRPGLFSAALTLDQAAGLKERLSTALAFRSQSDPFARAAVQDAEKIAARVHVPSHIRYQPPSLWPWSTATAAAALLLAWFMPTVTLFANEPDDEEQVSREAVVAEHQLIKAELEQKLNQIKELAQENPELKDVTADLKPLEIPDTPTVTPDDIRRDAARKIDDVRDKLEQQLESGDEDALKQTKRMLSQLNQPGNQPAEDKLSRALASGDFKSAKQALEELAEQLEQAAKNTSNPESREKLAEMQQQLQRLADQLTKLSDSVELQKELENKAGLSKEEAQKLLQQLKDTDPKELEKALQQALGDKLSQQQIQQLAQKMKQQQKASQSCKSLAQSMSKAAQGCQRCQSPGGSSSGAAQASDALSNAMSQLSDLEMTEQLMNELQAQIADLQNLRDNVCQGGMCRRKDGELGPIGPQGPNYGLGLGERIGKERTPYERTPTKAKSRYESGAVIGRMLVEGPQVRGEATAEEFAAVQSELRDAEESIEREEVPRQYHKALQTYFERLAGLMQEHEQQSGSTTEEQ